MTLSKSEEQAYQKTTHYIDHKSTPREVAMGEVGEEATDKVAECRAKEAAKSGKEDKFQSLHSRKFKGITLSDFGQF